MLKQDSSHLRDGSLASPSGTIFNRLRRDILSCQLAPDSRLLMDEMRAAYDVGLSPLREALMRLEAEGLVVLVQKKGFRVSPVSRDHLLDLGRIRAELECTALRWSIERGDVAWEADVVSSFHRLSRQPKVDPHSPGVIDESWGREHRIFHFALTAASDSPILRSILEALYDQAERYVALSIANQNLPRDDVAEHQALMSAALARDTAKACELCRQHVNLTTEKVAASLDSRKGHGGSDG